MRKIWDFHGGVHPPENKAQSNHQPIQQLPLPKQLIVPLNQHIGAPATPTVKVGDDVLKGQMIAEPQGTFSAAVHAPSSGQVSAIEARPIPHPSGLSALCVVITTDGNDSWCERQAIDDWRNTDRHNLVEHIRACGIAGMGGAGFPTAVKVQPRNDRPIDTLIINGTECEPYITADDMLMRERAEDIISGTEIVAHILGTPERIIIGIEDNKPEAFAAVTLAAQNTAIDVIRFPTKYPSGGEKQLIQILTGNEVPTGKLPADIGIVLQNVGTVSALHRAVTLGEPLISRVTTVVGESLKTQQNIEALIGTPIDYILQQHGFDASHCSRLIIGGPMMGYTIENTSAPVIKTTNCLLVPTKEEIPGPEPQQACIRCGMCSEACPASLLPQQLYWFSRSEDFDKLQSHNLFDCIECGACSYVCPSNIPLVQYYRASKGAIRMHNEEKQKAEHSRQRFEFRKVRLEQAGAEKEAKRLARKKAAEKAKQTLAEQATVPDTELKPTADETADAVKNRAKLERALSSAQSRVERAKKQVAEALELGDAARIDTLTARLKAAELKATEAQKKRDALDTAPLAAQQVHKKLSISPKEKMLQTIGTLEKRLATAKNKFDEAIASGSETADALRQGVEKLEQKLAIARNEIPSEDAKVDASPQEKSAADMAIAKAQARALQSANLTPEEKAKEKYQALQKRLDKARDRLKKAQQENDENIDAFHNSVEKLEKKLTEFASKAEA